MEEGNNSETASPTTPSLKKLGYFSPPFHFNHSLAKRCHQSSPDAIPVTLHGCKTSKLVVGRGHQATVKIGKANKRVSREHVTIEHKPHLNGFELTILSPNGALIDHIVFDQGEHIPIIEGTIIEIVGNKLIFQGPKEDRLDIPIVETIPVKVTPVIVEEIVEEKKKPVVNSMSLEDKIIQVLVYSKKSTMTSTDITKKLQEHLNTDIDTMLINSPVIGCVPRSGKLADGSAKEDLYYYKADIDTNIERRKQYTDVGRSARKCTMKDTQYFFRIPKLPNSKASTNSKIRKRANHAREQQEDEELKSSHSGDEVSDMEVYELFKDV